MDVSESQDMQMEGSGNTVSDTVTVTVPKKVSGCLRTCRWRVLVTLLLSNFWSPSVCPVNVHQYSMIHKEKVVIFLVNLSDKIFCPI